MVRSFHTSRSSAGGVSGCREASGSGSRSMMALITLTGLVPSNARFPVSIS
ncbi:MAG: hypothetical protein KBA95_04560 [Acidobacteria bacterium]|nr:hypothetical protein [Acidobacteriota bacterium]